MTAAAPLWGGGFLQAVRHLAGLQFYDLLRSMRRGCQRPTGRRVEGGQQRRNRAAQRLHIFSADSFGDLRH
jgi:hypothetical protein